MVYPRPYSKGVRKAPMVKPNRAVFIFFSLLSRVKLALVQRELMARAGRKKVSSEIRLVVCIIPL